MTRLWVIHSRTAFEARHALSDQIDILLTNRVLGLPIFIILMYLVFQLTFTVADPPMQWIEQGFGWLANVIDGFWPKTSDSLLKSLLASPAGS